MDEETVQAVVDLLIAGEQGGRHEADWAEPIASQLGSVTSMSGLAEVRPRTGHVVRGLA